MILVQLKERIEFKYEHWQYFENEKDYINERLPATLVAGLFPVIYTSQRVKLPFTKLRKFDIHNRELVDEILYKAYITKSTNWSYEKEWRLIVDDRVSGFYANKIHFPIYIKNIFGV